MISAKPMSLLLGAALGSVLLMGALVAGCDNGNDSAELPVGRAVVPVPTPTRNYPLPIIAPKVIAYGTVAAPGSVSVNGVEYDAARATVMFDGVPGALSALRVGDIVLVTGELNPGGATGVAELVVASSAVKGPITSIDAASRTFVALGQRVKVDADTSFDDSVPQRSLAGLARGDVVQVAGFRRGDGEIAATRIAVQAFGTRELSVTGIATDLDPVGQRFAIGGLVVDYGSAAIEGFASGAVANGDLVAVEGVWMRRGELVARSVSLASDPVANRTGYRVELEGYSSECSVPDKAMLCKFAGVGIETSPATVFEGGDYYNLRSAVTKARVEGTVRADGVIAVIKVLFPRPSPNRISALVDSVNQDESSFVTLGITVITDAVTRFADRSGAQLQPFGLEHLAPGDFVRVSGGESRVRSGIVVASLVERVDSQSETRVRGYLPPMILWSGVRQQLSILGVTVYATDATRYPTPNGSQLSEDTFFYDLGPWSLIEARGVEVADREVVASELRYALWGAVEFE